VRDRVAPRARRIVAGASGAGLGRPGGARVWTNLHSVAIGVATALTAIHGAGVIHRDLKPRNVLLAPGTPKVIDFGIARALEATSGHTRTDQMVGTVAYMAPERFGSEPGTVLTPAADIFAWGSVVGYAGMGRTPFRADSPPATAARILTQPPDLSGPSGPLRDLVAPRWRRTRPTGPPPANCSTCWSPARNGRPRPPRRSPTSPACARRRRRHRPRPGTTRPAS
jgi:serine/threonine protein kinase